MGGSLSYPFKLGSCLLSVVALFCWTACGTEEVGQSWEVEERDGDSTRYGDGTTVVVTVDDDEGTTYVVSGNPDECVQFDKYCIDLEEATGHYCDEPGAQADVIVVDGEVVEVICYPPADDGTPIQEVTRDEDGNAEIEQTANGMVVVFGDETDGEPIVGDLILDAERAVIYGNGIDRTILDGDVTVSSNNSRIRGVTITGDVTYTLASNGSKLSFCKIHGDLEVVSNDFSVVHCQIFGNVTIKGNTPTLINVGVGGEWKVEGTGPFCEGCYSFDDVNGDFHVNQDEFGDPLSCGD